jgi:ABC-2 type transport system ATP-binding protein
MRILATLDRPTSGEAFVDGFSVVDDPDRVRSRLGFMPDSFNVYPDINVREYLDFFARAYGLRGTARRRALSFAMSFTQLDGLANKPMVGLSKGMKQRLCLGRAIVHDPAVLILDEPAAGLDPRARIELREMVRTLASMGKSVLISSHILTELAEMCDAVGIMERGELLAVGSVDEIQHRHGGSEVGHRSLSVRLLGDPGPFLDWLRARPLVHAPRQEGESTVFEHNGDGEAEADLLRDAIAAGFRVVGFAAQTRSLEAVFLQVTKGIVQ